MPIESGNPKSYPRLERATTRVSKMIILPATRPNDDEDCTLVARPTDYHSDSLTGPIGYSNTLRPLADEFENDAVQRDTEGRFRDVS
jgi:hypothetical protein